MTWAQMGQDWRRQEARQTDMVVGDCTTEANVLATVPQTPVFLKMPRHVQIQVMMMHRTIKSKGLQLRRIP